MAKRESWTLDPQDAIVHPALASEEYLGGVYLLRYIKEPVFPLRDPRKFLVALLQKLPAASKATGGVQTAADAERVLLVAHAAALLLQAQPLLSAFAAEQGYVQVLSNARTRSFKK